MLIMGAGWFRNSRGSLHFRKKGTVMRMIIGMAVIISFMPGCLFGQQASGAVSEIDSNKLSEERNPHVVCYIPGISYGYRSDTNLFTRTYCRRMREIMESGFLILHDTKKAGSVNNVFWALWHAQYPLKNPEHDKRIAGSINSLVSCSLSRKSEITLVSSSYGTVVAAQLALYLVKNRERLGLSPEPLNLVFASSMISKESRLFNELEALKSKKLIGAIVYDDLQYPGDNVTGMCGKTRLQAIREVRRIAFPLAGTYKGQPSILNKDPLNGHVHRKRELSTDKVNDYIAKPLVDHELAGPYYRARALNYLSR